MVFQCLQYHNLKSEHDVYRCKDCIRSKSLTAQTMGVINLKKRFLQTKKKKWNENARIRYICEKEIQVKNAKDKNIIKVGTIVMIQANVEVLQISYVISSIVYLKKFL